MAGVARHTDVDAVDHREGHARHVTGLVFSVNLDVSSAYRLRYAWGMVSHLKASELGTLVGRILEPSEWFLVDQSRIDSFADATLDHQFIHVDPDRAAKTPFGTTVAHGFLTLSLLSHLCKSSGFVVEGALMSVNYGLNRVRFVSPVAVGSEIRAVRTVKGVEPRPRGQYLLTSEVTVEIRGKSKPAMIAEWLALLVFPES
jgi:acyl dehydratase